MAKALIPTAKEINEAHQFAKECAENAIEWALKCGQLLAAKKKELGHGEFQAWVGQWCNFSVRMAQRYMLAGKNDTRVAFASLRQALGHDKPKAKSEPNTPKGAVPVVNPKGTGETGADRPAAPASPPTPPQASASAPSAGEPEWTDADEAAVVAEQDADEQSRIAKAMAADDKLAEAFAQIKLQAGEIAVLKRSRDHYMNQAGEAARLVQARDREIAKLKKQIARQAA